MRAFRVGVAMSKKTVGQTKADNGRRQMLKMMTIRLDNGLYEKITKASKRLGITRSAFVKSVVSTALINGFSLKEKNLK